MLVRVIGVDKNLIHSNNVGTSGHLRDNRRIGPDSGLLYRPGSENGPRDALMNKFLVQLQLTLHIERRQFGGGSSTTWGTINSATRKENRILGMGTRHRWFAKKLHMGA